MKACFIAAGLMVAATAASSAQTIVFEGRRSILPTVTDSLETSYLLDLDRGQTGTTAQTTGELILLGRPGSERLQPSNGAQIALVRGSGIGFADCQRAALAETPLDARSIRAGDYLCVRTNLGNVSRIEFLNGLSAREPVLRLDITTWEPGFGAVGVIEPDFVAVAPRGPRMSCGIVGLEGGNVISARMSVQPQSDGDAVLEGQVLGVSMREQLTVPASWREDEIRFAEGDRQWAGRVYPKAEANTFAIAGRYGLDGEHVWFADCAPETFQTALVPLLEPVADERLQVSPGQSIDFIGQTIRDGLADADVRLTNVGLEALGSARVSFYHASATPRAEDCGRVVATQIPSGLLQEGSWSCVRMRDGRLATVRIEGRNLDGSLSIGFAIFDNRR